MERRGRDSQQRREDTVGNLLLEIRKRMQTKVAKTITQKQKQNGKTQEIIGKPRKWGIVKISEARILREQN